MSTVVVVAPHPDDETLGCGGALLRHRAAHDEIHWLIMTTVDCAQSANLQRAEARAREIEAVSKNYSFASVSRTTFLTAQLDRVPMQELVSAVSACFMRVQPDTVYLPWRGDIHSDHKIVFDAAAACTKSFRYPFIRRIRAYETISETEFGMRPESSFTPNLWIDISGYLDRKIEIMRLYAGEMGEHPFPRSEKNIRALAAFRGAAMGCEAAEAFMTLKEFVR